PIQQQTEPLSEVNVFHFEINLNSLPVRQECDASAFPSRLRSRNGSTTSIRPTSKFCLAACRPSFGIDSGEYTSMTAVSVSVHLDTSIAAGMTSRCARCHFD